MADAKPDVTTGTKRTRRVGWNSRDEQIEYKCVRQIRHRKKMTAFLLLALGATAASAFFSAGILVVFPLACASLIALVLLIEANSHLKEIRGRA